jgi:hypothetical protein
MPPQGHPLRQISFRCDEALIRALREAARYHGRSLSHEVLAAVESHIAASRFAALTRDPSAAEHFGDALQGEIDNAARLLHDRICRALQIPPEELPREMYDPAPPDLPTIRV